MGAVRVEICVLIVVHDLNPACLFLVMITRMMSLLDITCEELWL